MKHECAASLWGKIDMCSMTSREDPIKGLYPSGNWYCHHHDNRLSRLSVDLAPLQYHDGAP